MLLPKALKSWRETCVRKAQAGLLNKRSLSLCRHRCTRGHDSCFLQTQMAEEFSDDGEVHPSDAYVRKAQARLTSAADSSPPAVPQTEVLQAGPAPDSALEGAAAAQEAPLQSARSKKHKSKPRKHKRKRSSSDGPGATPDAAAEPREASAEDVTLRASHSSGRATPQPGGAVATATEADAAAAGAEAERPASAAAVAPGLTPGGAIGRAAERSTGAGPGPGSAAAAAKRKKLPAPVGVVVVADDAETVRAPEMQRLLRAPRCAPFCARAFLRKHCACARGTGRAVKQTPCRRAGSCFLPHCVCGLQQISVEGKQGISATSLSLICTTLASCKQHLQPSASQCGNPY